MLTYVKSGKAAPIEARPSPDGNIHIDLDHGTYIILRGAELDKARERGIQLYLNHFSTCEFRGLFTKTPAPNFEARVIDLAATEILIVDRIKGVVRAGTAKTCAGCQNQLLTLREEPDCYRCPHCLAKVCMICGCSEERACPGGCFWAGPGFCSTHLEELALALKAGALPSQERA